MVRPLCWLDKWKAGAYKRPDTTGEPFNRRVAYIRIFIFY